MKNSTATAALWLAVAPVVSLVHSGAHAAPAKTPATKTPTAKAPATKAPVAKTPAKESVAAPAKTPSVPVVAARPAATPVATVVVPVVAAAPTVVEPTAPQANPIAAQVNNDKLLRADLERGVDATKSGEKSLQTGTAAAQKAIATIRQSQIENWINSRLLLQEAAKRRITAPPAKVEALLKAAKKQFLSAAAYQAFLKSGGKTEASLRKIYSERLVLDELSHRLAADVTVSNAELKAFYDAPTGEFEIPNQARARHILLIVPLGISAEDKAKTRARALEILKKAQAPNADFNALIAEFSEDEGKANDNGDTGPFSLDESFKEMKPFADAVFAAQAGQILGPIETVFGYHIIRVDEASHKPALDGDLKITIRAYLIKQRVAQKLDAILAQAKKTAVIKINQG